MLKKFAFFVVTICLLKSVTVTAQADYTIGSNKSTSIKTVNVLADNNYTLQQILTDTALHFVKQEKINIKGLTHYWAKLTIKNNSSYDEQYAIWVSPPFDNVLYAYNHDSVKWNAIKSGQNISNNTSLYRYAPVLCKSNSETVFYSKINVSAFKGNNYALGTEISVEKLSKVEKRLQDNYTLWLVTIFIVLCFALYNAYLYYMFKDRVYLYYLLALISGIVYITGISFNMANLTSFKILTTKLYTNGGFGYLPTDIAVANIAIAFVLLGLVQFARHYLQTALYLPKWDRLLKYTISFFVVYQVSYVLIQLNDLSTNENLFIQLSNVFVFLLIALMLTTGFVAYRKKVKQAKYFIQAQLLPLVLIICIVVGLLFSYNNSSWALHLLPNIAIVAQTLTFAIALVARVNLLKNELHFKTLENQQIAGQIAIEQERNVRLEEKIEFDKRDIAAAKQIKLLMKELHHRVKNNLQIVSSLLSLQSFRITDTIAANAVREGQHRIEAMSLIHQRLYTHDNITAVNIKEYVTDLSENLMLAYGYSKTNFVLNLNINNEMMDVDKAIPLSLIINELVTNAFKYAYTTVAKPILTITLTKEQNDMQLYIADNGNGLDMEAWQNNKGYGKELVQTFTKQLDGEITVTINGGTTFTIIFPSHLTEAT